MTTKSTSELILSSDARDEICKLLNIKDQRSTKLVITLELGEPVNVEHHFYANKDSSDE